MKPIKLINGKVVWIAQNSKMSIITIIAHLTNHILPCIILSIMPYPPLARRL